MAKKKKKLKAQKFRGETQARRTSRTRKSLSTGKATEGALSRVHKKLPFYERDLSQYLPLIPKSLSFFLWYLALPFFLLCAIFLLHEPLLLRPLNLYDEGVSVLGAKRLLVGEVPYKEFFSIYTPLKFSWLSKVFAVYGPSLLASRTFSLGISMFGFFILYLLFKRFAHPVLAAIGTLCIAAFGTLSITPTIMLCVALWFSVFLKYSKNAFLPFVGGALFAILFLLRLDFGGFVGGAAFLLLAAFFIIHKDWKTFFVAFIKALFAFLIVTAPVYIWIIQSGGWNDFLHQTIIFPIFGEYQELRHLPYASFQDFLAVLAQKPIDYLELSKSFAWFFWPIPVALSFLYWTSKFVWSKWKKIPTDFINQGILTNILLCACCIAGLLYASHRSDIGHMTFLNILCGIFLFHLVFLFRQKLWGILFLPFFFLALYFPAHSLFEKRETILMSPKITYSFFPTPFPWSQENDELQHVLEYFDDIPVREKVYVGVKDTSRVYINNVMLPFLLRQPVATKYHELHTGIVTKKDVQQEMIEELQDVDHVVLWETFYCEDNKSCESTGVRDLDIYVEENFFLVKKIGKYEIMKRR